MFFTVSSHAHDCLPYSKKITNNLWLHTASPDQFVGYRLGELGGCFVSIDTEALLINYSFFKDFDLWHSEELGILISNNTPVQGQTLANDIVSTKIVDQKTQHSYFDWRTFYNQPRISKNQAVDTVKQLLLDNLLECQKVSSQNLQVVFTGGLDSSTLAFLCHFHRLPFKCLLDHNHQGYWKDLPFDNIQYVKVGTDPYSDLPDVRASFYQAEHNCAVTGFFGDCTVLHHSALFAQCQDLPYYAKVDNVYSNEPVEQLPRFRNTNQVLSAVRNTLISTRFRHWFKDFLVLDAYRDPRLAAAVMSLDWQDLVEQFGSGYIQKEIIKSLNPQWLDLICDSKNNYEKFKHLTK